MPDIYLGLGSNLGAAINLRLAIRELQRHFGELDVSAVYQNAPVGFDGDDFLNAVVRLRTNLEPKEILEILRSIHGAAGRRHDNRRFSPRTLDIDLLLYGRLVVDEAGLRLPRDDVLKYSFVLRPLAELAPDYVHPVTGRTLAEHWHEFDTGRHPLTKVDIDLGIESIS
jgi:2-amino-4-hydroxy-6-hydroxymethyldihydropteridine diphosphokinase